MEDGDTLKDYRKRIQGSGVHRLFDYSPRWDVLRKSFEKVFKLAIFADEKTLLPDLDVALEGKTRKNDFANFTTGTLKRQPFDGDVHSSGSGKPRRSTFRSENNLIIPKTNSQSVGQ